jgi:hypothetical protein
MDRSDRSGRLSLNSLVLSKDFEEGQSLLLLCRGTYEIGIDKGVQPGNFKGSGVFLSLLRGT